MWYIIGCIWRDIKTLLVYLCFYNKNMVRDDVDNLVSMRKNMLSKIDEISEMLQSMDDKLMDWSNPVNRKALLDILSCSSEKNVLSMLSDVRMNIELLQQRGVDVN